ncbi:pyocin activator PrtN family protein [Shewanella sp. Isolate7]|uniref:pyocin activator PrtN family protein n=1 Tax=Shewanella sp. Isolate7 TaxID=2908528 RepID=UPI001EFE61BB|nr:pyocin activator PrtN family protein [Shewanella sp. Isolate7]MCG9721856.1 pyocin activator PrtN family protein [Shewanella sp. Isolate7]
MMGKSKKTLTITHQLLLEQFSNRAMIPLNEIAESYLGLSLRTAKNRAKAGLLPFPVFKLSDSAKCPYLVHLDDLAKYIDIRNEEAKNDWR